jgi:quinolinate synthase
MINEDIEKIKNRIKNIKNELKNTVVIPTHHYQRMEIVDIGDYKGDSLKLAKWSSSQLDAKYIIFCGVRFMAESAAILAKPYQKVIHPNLTAGCPLADFGEIGEIEYAWREITSIIEEEKIVPITYINSWIDLKAFTGVHNGVICTSSNAGTIFKWALNQGKKIFFTPDEHLGRYTAKQIGIKNEEIIVWEKDKKYGGCTPSKIIQAKVILWHGYCHVHTQFTSSHVKEMREKYPNGKIVVHPECKEEVTKLVDAVGSTEFIVSFVEKSEKGSIIIIGTEINLVNRLARDYPDRKIVPLHPSLCPNMFRITLNDVLYVLENLDKNERVINVDENKKKDALLALERMFKIT